MATFEELKAVKRRHSADLLRREGVCGVDIDQDASGQPAHAAGDLAMESVLELARAFLGFEGSDFSFHVAQDFGDGGLFRKRWAEQFKIS